MREAHRAGEKLFIDYTGATTGLTDSSRAHIFVGAFGASSHTRLRDATRDDEESARVDCTCAGELLCKAWCSHRLPFLPVGMRLRSNCSCPSGYPAITYGGGRAANCSAIALRLCARTQTATRRKNTIVK